MAFSGNFVCDSFKTELFEGVHTFGVGGDQFKIALYDNNASFNASTTAYTTANEVAATGTYTAGGGNLTSLPLDLSSNTVLVDFADISFTGVTLNALWCFDLQLVGFGKPGGVCSRLWWPKTGH
jgi:hypothetical protein